MKLILLLFILFPYLINAQTSTTSPTNSADNDSTEGEALIYGAILFSIVCVGFGWLCYASEKKSNYLQRAETDRSTKRGSVASNSFTALPMTSPHNKALQKNHSDISVRSDLDLAADHTPKFDFTPEVGDPRLRKQSTLAGGWLDEESLRRNTVQAGMDDEDDAERTALQNAEFNKATSIEMAERLPDSPVVGKGNADDSFDKDDGIRSIKQARIMVTSSDRVVETPLAPPNEDEDETPLPVNLLNDTAEENPMNTGGADVADVKVGLSPSAQFSNSAFSDQMRDIDAMETPAVLPATSDEEVRSPALTNDISHSEHRDSMQL